VDEGMHDSQARKELCNAEDIQRKKDGNIGPRKKIFEKSQLNLICIQKYLILSKDISVLEGFQGLTNTNSHIGWYNKLLDSLALAI
jgi:hypothetical protein